MDLLRLDSWGQQWNIRVYVAWGEVYAGMVHNRMGYESVIYQISCFDIPLENRRHRRIILPCDRLLSASKSIYIWNNRLKLVKMNFSDIVGIIVCRCGKGQ